MLLSVSEIFQLILTALKSSRSLNSLSPACGFIRQIFQCSSAPSVEEIAKTFYECTQDRDESSLNNKLNTQKILKTSARSVTKAVHRTFPRSFHQAGRPHSAQIILGFLTVFHARSARGEFPRTQLNNLLYKFPLIRVASFSPCSQV